MESIKFNLHSKGKSRHKIGFRSISSNIKYLFDTSRTKPKLYPIPLFFIDSKEHTYDNLFSDWWNMTAMKGFSCVWVRIGMGYKKLWEDIWNSDELNGIRTFFVSLDLDGILKFLFDLFCDAIKIGIRNAM